MFDSLKPGQSIRCTVTKVPPTEDGCQTVMRLMRKDPAAIRALRRGQRRRRQNMLVYNRGNRDWTSRQTCGKIVRVQQGEMWSMTYTPDLARDFAAVAPFLSVTSARSTSVPVHPMTHIPVPRSVRERVVIAFVSLGLIIAGVGLLVVLPGCEKSAPTPTPASASGRGPAAATYTVRGRISALPSAQSDLQIEHEPIPDFKDESGKAIGMSTMIMPFPLAKGVSLDGLKAGDPFEFEFHVWWKPRVAYEVTRITKLPADTTLSFGAAKPAPAPAPAAEPAPAPSAPR